MMLLAEDLTLSIPVKLFVRGESFCLKKSWQIIHNGWLC